MNSEDLRKLIEKIAICKSNSASTRYFNEKHRWQEQAETLERLLDKVLDKIGKTI